MNLIDGSVTEGEEPVGRRGQATVPERVKQRLSACPYSYCFNRVSWRYADGTLTLEGSVASFYLKQLLQTMLRSVENVDRISNDVDVVSSTGLSSEHNSERNVPPTTSWRVIVES
jgi:hypothetical protein